MGLYLSSLPWAGWKKATPGLSHFGEPRATLSLDYELISLLVIAMEPSMPSSGFILELINTAYPLLGFCVAGYTASRGFHQPSGQMGPGDTLPSGWGYDSAPCWVMGKLGSRAGKILPLRT